MRPSAVGGRLEHCGRHARPRIHGFVWIGSAKHHGEWRSLVAHPAGGRAVAGSNPVSPIRRKPCKYATIAFRDRRSQGTKCSICVLFAVRSFDAAVKARLRRQRTE